MGSLSNSDCVKEGWEDWDPRVEDYLQHGGLGSSFTRSYNMVKIKEQTKEPVGLYVRNVPLSMTNDSLQRIFSEFGSVLSVFVGKRKGDFSVTFAIIKVPSKREALKMIENLHGRPPLNLLVCFALTEEERERKRAEKQMDRNFQQQLDEKYESDFIKQKKEEKDSRYDVQVKCVPNGCGRGKMLANTAKMFKGKKSLGVCSEEKGECWKENMDVNKEQERVETPPDSFDTVTEFGQGTVVGPYAQPKLCIGCALEYGRFRCSICKAWYCGKTCQIDDWFMHSQHCRPPPPLECIEDALASSVFDRGSQKSSDSSSSGDVRSKNIPSKPHHVTQSKFNSYISMDNPKRVADVQNSEIKQVDGPGQVQQSLPKERMKCDSITVPRRCFSENSLKKCKENDFNIVSGTEDLEMALECQRDSRNAPDTGFSQSFRRTAQNSGARISPDTQGFSLNVLKEQESPLELQVTSAKLIEEEKAIGLKRGPCITSGMKDDFAPVDRTLEAPGAPPLSSISCQEKFHSASETGSKSSQVSNSQPRCAQVQTSEPPPLRMPTSVRENEKSPVALFKRTSEGFPLTNISKHLDIDETYIGLITVVQSHRSFCALVLAPLACSVIGIDQESLEALPSAVDSKLIPGSLVLAYSPTFELWYRAYVYKVEESYIHVCYIDYGNLETVQVVKPMPVELCEEVPGLAVVARLHGEIEQSCQNWLQANIGIDKQVTLKVLAKKNKLLKVAILGDDGASVIAHFILQPWYAALPREQPGEKSSQDVQLLKDAHQEKKQMRDDGSISNIHSAVREEMVCKSGRTSMDEVSPRSSGAGTMKRQNELANVEQADGNPLSEQGFTLRSELRTSPSPKFWARDLSKQDLIVGTQYNVLPVWVIQGNILCVQIITEKNVEFYKKIEQKINASCEKGTPPNSVQVGELVCGFITSDGIWYRAEVTAVEENYIHVFFIDFGNSERLPPCNLQQIDKTLVEIPALCIQATLDKVCQDSLEASQYLKELVRKEKEVIMEVVSLDPLKVNILEDGSLVNIHFHPNSDEHSGQQDLFQMSTNNRVSKTPPGNETGKQEMSVQLKKSVKYIGYASADTRVSGNHSGVACPATKVEDAVQKLKEKLYKPKMLMYDECASVELPVGKDIPVIVLQAADPFSIFVAPQSCIDVIEGLEEMSEEMNAYCNSKHATYYRPCKGEVCIAKFSSDERWYRAACLTLGVESALVIFTDYGNIETVDYADMCQMVDPFLSLPLLAQHCVLGGVKEKEQSEGLSTRLSELLPLNSICLVEVRHQQEDSTYMIDIPDIVDTLVAEGLLERV